MECLIIFVGIIYLRVHLVVTQLITGLHASLDLSSLPQYRKRGREARGINDS